MNKGSIWKSGPRAASQLEQRVSWPI